MSVIDDPQAMLDRSNLFTDGTAFLDLERWHRAVDGLRDEGPFVRVDDDHHGTFWATVDLEVLLEVSRQPDVFANTTAPLLPPKLGGDAPSIDEVGAQLKMLINQDGPDHLAHRKLVVEWFKRSTLRVLKPAVDDLVAESMSHLRDLDGECDFSTEVALPLPLRVIMSMLGVPREDEPVLLKLTQDNPVLPDGRCHYIGLPHKSLLALRGDAAIVPECREQ